jgi:uncharacterized protein YjbI with pentapeptide repeats
MFRVITSGRRWVWIAIFLAFVFAFLAVVIYLPRLSFVVPTGGLTADQRARAQSDFRGHLLQAFGGLVLIVGAYFTGRTFALNREGQITERFTRAVEQLANDEKLDVRLGGIYALERIARDSETHYEAVMEVLTAFLREHTRGRQEDEDAADSTRVPTEDAPRASERWAEVRRLRALRADFQTVATVIGRRDRRYERKGYRLDLRRVYLRGADLHEAVLNDADLFEAHLEGADLTRAYLEGADLTRAYLEGALLSEAHLERASLPWAHLEEAWLSEAHLEGAYLSEAHVERAHLTGAHLEGAWLGATHLEDARLGGAVLKGAFLGDAFLEGAVIAQAHLEGADLSEVIGLDREQVGVAFKDDDTKLPEDLTRGTEE